MDRVKDFLLDSNRGLIPLILAVWLSSVYGTHCLLCELTGRGHAPQECRCGEGCKCCPACPRKRPAEPGEPSERPLEAREGVCCEQREEVDGAKPTD